MALPKDDAAILSARWTEGVLLKRDVFSTVERGRFRDDAGEVDAVLRRLDQVPVWSYPLARHLFARERHALTLARDLENHSIWTEHSHTPTWHEYVRHNGRIPKAAAMVGERLRALHSGDEPPRVRRVIERPPTAGTALVMAKGPIEH